MTDELIDIYDIEHNPIGTAMKSQAHAQGLWHKNIHCWIYDPVKKLVLFQRRADDKKVYPGLLDISAAGHVGAGEDEVETCVREVSEELGIECTAEDLRFIGVHTMAFRTRKVINCEFGYTYLLPRNIDIDQYILQEEEISGIYAVSLDDCFRLFAREVETIPAVGKNVGQNNSVKKNIAINDIIPFTCEYFISIFIMIERAIEGKKYLGIG